MKSFNYDKLLEQFDGDQEILQEVAQEFVQTIDELVSNIETSYAAKDYTTFERATHTLKGAASNFLAKDVVEFSFQLEKMARQQSLEGADQVLNKLNESVKVLRSDLQELLGS